MKAKRKTAAKAKREPGRLSRSALIKQLGELIEQLDEQAWLADAIFTANRPNGEHITIEHRYRTVMGLQLEALKNGLLSVVARAKIIQGAAT